MQRHWEGVHFHEEVEKRAKELASFGLQDVGRYIWLPKCRRDFAQSAFGPLFEEEMLTDTKIRKKKKRVSGSKARRKTSYSNWFSEDLVHSKCRRSVDYTDLLRFFSTKNVDLQKLLLDAIVKHHSKEGKDLAQRGYGNHKDGREPTLPWGLYHKTGSINDRQPIQRGRSSCTAQSNLIPAEAVAPWSVRDWTDDLPTQQSNFNIENFCSDEFSDLRPQTAVWTSNASCRLTNSSRPVSGRCGKEDTENEGTCRDVTTQRGSKFHLKTRDQSREIVKLVADHSSQTSSRREHSVKERSEEDFENLQEQTPVNALQCWAEPLEQYLTDLQNFEEELRERWLTPEETATTPALGAQRSDVESVRVLHAANSPRASEMKIIRVSSGEVKPRLDVPLSNTKYDGAPGDELTLRPELTHRGAFGPIFDNLQQENCAIHGLMVQPSTQPELWPTDKYFHKPRPETVPAKSSASGPNHSQSDFEILHSKSTEEFFAAGSRIGKPVEWWPNDNLPLPKTKPRSAPGIFSVKPRLYRVFDSRSLPGKTKREQTLGDKTHQKPEWWPALRRPYSASEIEATRRKRDAEKATKKPPKTKIVARYPVRRLPAPSSNKPQRRTGGETEFTKKCTARQDEDSLKLTLQIRNARPPSAPPRKVEYRKKMGELQKAYGCFQKPYRPRVLSTVEQSTTRKSPKCKTGHGGLHASREQDQFKLQLSTSSTSITAKEHVSGIRTPFQPEQRFKEASCLLYPNKTLGGVNIQAVALSQNTQQELRGMAPVVELHNEKHDDNKTRKSRHQSNFCLQRRIERLADKLIDQAVNEVASELAEFCETVAVQMYMAEFMT